MIQLTLTWDRVCKLPRQNLTKQTLAIHIWLEQISCSAQSSQILPSLLVMTAEETVFCGNKFAFSTNFFSYEYR